MAAGLQAGYCAAADSAVIPAILLVCLLLQHTRQQPCLTCGSLSLLPLPLLSLPLPPHRDLGQSWLTIGDFLVLLIFVADIGISFCLAYYDSAGRLVTEPRLIAAHYARWGVGRPGGRAGWWRECWCRRLCVCRVGLVVGGPAAVPSCSGQPSQGHGCEPPVLQPLNRPMCCILCVHALGPCCLV